MTYFLPHWDDLLDPHFDVKLDRFSDPRRSGRSDAHCHNLMQPTLVCDGVLVSLDQR